MVEENKLIERIVCGVSFGPFEKVDFLVYETERLEKLKGEYIFIRERVFKNKETGAIISRTYLGEVGKTS